MNKGKILIYNLSGIYENQLFYEKAAAEGANVICGKDFEGINCYCDENAVCVFLDKMQQYSCHGLHFLDSGNYHYISYLWLQQIQEPFCLIYFDNHPDMKPSLFEELLSCGGWVREALHKCTLLQHVLCIGVDEKLLTEEMKQEEKVTFITRQQIKKPGEGGELDAVEDLCEQISAQLKEKVKRLPVYLSVDKDVLSKDVVRTNWEQGSMTEEMLFTALAVIFKETEVIGMDICGEESMHSGRFGRKIHQSDRLNQQFIHFINNL